MTMDAGSRSKGKSMTHDEDADDAVVPRGEQARATKAPAERAPEPQTASDDDADDENFGNRAHGRDPHDRPFSAQFPKTGETHTLNVTMSATLYRKIQQIARDEGVSTDDFACELLAEGLVLRAWEIVEKKSALRGSAPTHQHQHQHGGGGNQRHGKGHNQRRNNNKGRGGYGNTLNLMEDKAAFLEYVRNQEKQRRR